MSLANDNNSDKSVFLIENAVKRTGIMKKITIVSVYFVRMCCASQDYILL